MTEEMTINGIPFDKWERINSWADEYKKLIEALEKKQVVVYDYCNYPFLRFTSESEAIMDLVKNNEQILIEYNALKDYKVELINSLERLTKEQDKLHDLIKTERDQIIELQKQIESSKRNWWKVWRS